MQETIISAAAGILGALIGGYATYKAVDKQIKEERRVREEESADKIVLTGKVIIQFLWNEIEHNMNILDYPNGFIWNRLESDVPFRHPYSEFRFVYEEFNKVKFELLKYDMTAIKNVLDIYWLFGILSKYSDMNDFSIDEYNQIKQLPIIYLSVNNFIKEGKILWRESVQLNKDIALNKHKI